MKIKNNALLQCITAIMADSTSLRQTTFAAFNSKYILNFSNAQGRLKRIYQELLKSISKLKIKAYKPVTDGYTRPLAFNK